MNDKNFAKKIFRNIDLVYHLAGITKVPNTDVNLNKRREKVIYNNSVNIMNNLVNNISKSTKVVFPSTHLVFEDCKKNKTIFNEKSRPLPKLAYSRGKLECEKILENKQINYRILRLGSVYGFAEKKNVQFAKFICTKSKKQSELKSTFWWCTDKKYSFSKRRC